MRRRSARRLVPFPCKPPDADGEDGYVMCGLNLLRDLFQVHLAEAVETGTDQNNILVPLDPIHSVDRVIKSIEQVGLRKARYAQLVQGAENRSLILREIQ